MNLKPDLRRLVVKRRIAHKMFDMIKCNAWESIISDHQYKFLVLRETYLTFELISQPRLLELHLDNLC